jgi:hypothetical protein
MPIEPDGLRPLIDEADAAPANLPSRRTPTTPRLAALDPDSRRSLPPMTLASLRLPVSIVEERTTALASQARVLGSHHSLRVWRAAHREALAQLAREASSVPTGVQCEALFWELDGDLYHVSATFASPRPTIH